MWISFPVRSPLVLLLPSVSAPASPTAIRCPFHIIIIIITMMWNVYSLFCRKAVSSIKKGTSFSSIRRYILSDSYLEKRDTLDYALESVQNILYLYVHAQLLNCCLFQFFFKIFHHHAANQALLRAQKNSWGASTWFLGAIENIYLFFKGFEQITETRINCYLLKFLSNFDGCQASATKLDWSGYYVDL